MMSRWTSFVPPPKVRISAARCARSIRPASTSPADPDRTCAPAPSTSINSRYASTANSVPNTFVADASAGPIAPPAPLAPPDAIFQLTSLRNSALACTRARCSCTHSASITRCPPASLADAAQSRTSASADITGAAEVSATRSWLSWLVISGQPRFSSPTSAETGTRTEE
jgi:hypothetical protein